MLKDYQKEIKLFEFSQEGIFEDKKKPCNEFISLTLLQWFALLPFSYIYKQRLPSFLTMSSTRKNRPFVKDLQANEHAALALRAFS